MKPNGSVPRLFALCVMSLLMLAGCAQGPEARKPAQAAPPSSAAPAAQKAVVPAPVAPAPPAPMPIAATGAASEAELTMVSGTVTKVSKEAGLLELQTPSGWSRFIITDPERKKDLERVTVGEKVDVKVDFRTSERKVIAVLRQNPSPPTRAESK